MVGASVVGSEFSKGGCHPGSERIQKQPGGDEERRWKWTTKEGGGHGGGGHRGSVGTGRGRKARRKAEGWHNWGLPPEPAQPSNLSMFDPILSLCTSIVRFHLSFFYWRTMEDCHQQCVLQTNQIVVIFAVVGTALKCSLGDLSQSIETCFLLLFGPPHPPKS